MTGIANIRRDKGCRILKNLNKSNPRSHLSPTHDDKRKAWAEDNL